MRVLDWLKIGILYIFSKTGLEFHIFTLDFLLRFLNEEGFFIESKLFKLILDPERGE